MELLNADDQDDEATPLRNTSKCMKNGPAHGTDAVLLHQHSQQTPPPHFCCGPQQNTFFTHDMDFHSTIRPISSLNDGHLSSGVVPLSFRSNLISDFRFLFSRLFLSSFSSFCFTFNQRWRQNHRRRFLNRWLQLFKCFECSALKGIFVLSLVFIVLI